jgi:TorA maturation chaperone TorD
LDKKRFRATGRQAITPNSLGEVAAEDMLRANTYMLLASLLRAPPDAEALDGLGAIEAGEGEMGEALARLAAAAGDSTPQAIDDEFHDLFIGVGAGELSPYASYYLTGFLYDKPLAALRQDMAGLGIAKDDDVAEPEDHVAALFEMMCGLITGAFGEPVDLARQQAFFDAHIAPWAEQFFADVEAAECASFYKPVGTIGKLFLRIESQSFEMAA